MATSIRGRRCIARSCASMVVLQVIDGETTPFVSKHTFEWCKNKGIKLRDGNDVRVGDIVICSYKGKDFTNPCELGRVLKVCKSQKLVGAKGEEHPDGPIGHIYVLTYKKQKAGRKKLECKQEAIGM